jgi:phosphoribosylamine-glycine ligase
MQNLPKTESVTFIVKPDSMCQGKGIFLAKTVEQIFEKTKFNELLVDQENQEKIGYVV